MEASEVISWLLDVREPQNSELPHNDPSRSGAPHTMPTPPVSLSPKKRRLDDDDDGYDEPAPKSGDGTGGRGQQSTAPLPLRPFDPRYKLQASSSRFSSKLGSETSSRSKARSTSRFSSKLDSETSSRSKARSTSPVKQSLNLRLLAKPVEFVPCKDPFAQIPADAHSLLSGIRRVTGIRQSAYIPATARDIIERELPDGKEWPDRLFFQADDAQGTPSPALAEMQFKALQDISDTAQRSMKQKRSELAWNSLVHCPLLQLATRSFSRGGVVCEPVMSAGIASQWLPEMAGKPMAAANKDAVAAGKMVDFVLALDIDSPRPRDQELADAVLEVLKHQTDESLSINHTLYEPLQLNPIGVSIETKVTAAATDGTLQLGIWTAAWHRRMRDLGYTDRLITLPLVLCRGHDWSLYFACDRGHNIDIVGPLPLGNTDAMESLYSLFAALVELCKWVEGTLRDWWITQLGGDPTAG